MILRLPSSPAWSSLPWRCGCDTACSRPDCCRATVAWLARRQHWYTAALQRFWLGQLAQILIVQPTEAFAQDLRQFEQAFVDRALGEPGRGVPVDPQRPLVQVDGWPGQLLGALAARLDRLEQHLLLRERGGCGERLLRRLAAYLATLENLLEQPRYLMMAVMATFVVIL